MAAPIDYSQQASSKLAALNGSINTAVQRLIASPDPQVQAQGRALAIQNGVTPGATQSAPMSLTSQVGHALTQAGGDALGGIGKTLDTLERPAQAILHGVNAFSGDGVQGLTDPNHWATAATQLGQGLTGEAPNINFRQSMNIDPNTHAAWDKGGIAAGAADTILGGVFDPTSYVTLGQGAAAEQGLKQLSTHLLAGGADAAATSAILKDVARKGAGTALDDTQQTAFRDFLHTSAPEGTDAAQYADKMINAIQQPQGVHLAGLDKPIIKYGDNLAPVAQKLGLVPAISQAGEVGDAGVLKAIANSSAGQAVGKVVSPITTPIANTFKNAFITGQPIKEVADAATSADAMHGISSAVEGANQAASDTANRASAIIKQTGVTDAELKSVVVPAVQSGAPEVAAKALEAAGNQPLADAVRGLGTLAQSAGINSAKDIPFEFTKHGAKAFAKDPEAVASSLGIGVKDLQKALDSRTLPTPAIIPGNVKPEALQALRIPDLANAEQKLQQTGLTKGKDFLNHNIANLTVQASHEQATQKLTADFLKSQTSAATKAGDKFVLQDTAKGAKEANAKGYVTRELGDGTKVHIHPALDKVMHDTAAIINQDQTIKGFDSTLQHLNRLWKGYAVLSPGFHQQNMVGNVFMNTLAGMRNPKYYSDALRLQKAIHTASASGKPFAEAIRGVGLSNKQIKAVEAARAEHTIDNGYYTAQQAVRAPKVADQTAAGKVKAAASKINPLDTNNVYLHGNRAIGGMFEQNSRLAHFLWKYEQTGDARQAAESVNKYLFNYNDLTSFEKKRLQAVSPFMTYMRKNIPAQYKFIAAHPGAYNNIGRAKQNALAAAPDDGTQYDPNKLAAGALPVNIPGLGTVLLDPRDPLDAAKTSTQPLAALQSLIPGSPNHGQVPQAAQTAAQGILGNVGGFTGTVAKSLASVAGGNNVNTGAALKPGGIATAGSASNLIAGGLNPLVGKALSTYNAQQSGNNATGLRNALGAPIYAGGDTATQGTLQGRLANVQAAIAQAGAQFGAANVPTTAALRKAGKVAPKAHKARAPRHKSGTKKSHHKK